MKGVKRANRTNIEKREEIKNWGIIGEKRIHDLNKAKQEEKRRENTRKTKKKKQEMHEGKMHVALYSGRSVTSI